MFSSVTDNPILLKFSNNTKKYVSLKDVSHLGTSFSKPFSLGSAISHSQSTVLQYQYRDHFIIHFQIPEYLTFDDVIKY